MRKEPVPKLSEMNQNPSLHFYPISIPPKADLPDGIREEINFGELS